MKGLVCRVKSLDTMLMAMEETREVFKQGRDSLETLILGVSQLFGKALNIQGGFMAVGKAVKS